MKYITTMFMVSMFALLGAVVVLPQTAAAACYYDDGVQYCTTGSVSWSNSSTGTYGSQNRMYNHGYYVSQAAQLRAYIRQLERLVAQLERLENEQRPAGYVLGYNTSRDGALDVVTRSATDVEDDEARLRGEIDWNGEDEATVYFEYGRSSLRLTEETTMRVLDEDDDDEDFSAIITNLRDDTRYYYRAVAEDEDGYRRYGSVRSFVTDDGYHRDDDDDYPEVDVDSATNISDDSARLRGEVDMNDFRNGVVFFVYGEDEDQVDDVEDDYETYREVDEDGDDLQKVRVDSDLDTEASYYANIYGGLDDDTRIYFNLCVEFEDEDDDDRIVCGDTEDFRTDD